MSLKRISSMFLVFIFLMIHNIAFAAKDEIPKPVGDIYVQDFADVLDESEKIRLKNLGRQIEYQTSSQIAILTVKSLGEKGVEEFSNEAYRSFALGTEENDNGVLIVLALKEKKVRIEVGYGLEGTIPDGKAGRILDKYAIPYLKNGHPNLAILNTYQALANEVTGNEKFNNSPQEQQGATIPTWLIIIIVVVVIFLDISFFGGTLSYALLSVLARGRGGGGPRGGGGGSSGGGGASRGW